ncbi:conserved hypothetical protein [Burkholderia vietnamiensis]|nr:conserved hypothetical protein [Burkholderia vietnamiensis]
MAGSEFDAIVGSSGERTAAPVYSSDACQGRHATATFLDARTLRTGTPAGCHVRAMLPAGHRAPGH